jgi:hypothetical protein
MIRYKQLWLIVAIVVLASLLCCVPKKADEGVSAMLVKEKVQIYKAAKGSDLAEEYANDWQEIAVFNKDKPELELLSNNDVKKWFSVKYANGTKTGWVNEDNLIFKDSEPEAAVVGYKADVFAKPDSRGASIKTLVINENIKLLGYKYSDGNREFKFISFGNNEKGWAYDKTWIIPGGRIGVVYKESALFNDASDTEANLVKDLKLNEFDIVIVYPEASANFFLVGLMQYPSVKKYYTWKNGISFNTDDLALAMKMNPDYQFSRGFTTLLQAKKIVTVVEDATKTENVLEYIMDKIKDVPAAINELSDKKSELEDTLKDGRSSDLTYFLTKFVERIDATIAELEKI